VWARGLDPWPFGLDQAPLVDFCNQHNPRARPPDRLSPVSVQTSAASVRLRASPAPLSGVAFAPPSDRVPVRDASGSGGSPHRPQARATTESPHRVRVAPSRRLRASLAACREPLPDEAETPSDRVDGHQSRFHGPGAERLSPPATLLAAALSGAGERAFIPTRSARTPLVVGSRQRRLETRRCQAPNPFGSSAWDDPTSPTPPPRRVGAGGPSTTRLRGAACRALRCRAFRLARRAQRETRRLRGRIRGRGPHPPIFREEDRDLPHPRCLSSMSRPPSSTRPDVSRATLTGGPGGDEPRPCNRGNGLLSTACCQAVENVRRLLQSRWIRRPWRGVGQENG